jgi:hypothetical protein
MSEIGFAQKVSLVKSRTFFLLQVTRVSPWKGFSAYSDICDGVEPTGVKKF